MAEKKRILFVCLGNIVRSPLAESLFLKHAREQGVEEKYDVDSAGTSGYHVGESPDPRMIRAAARRNHHYDHTSRQVTLGDLRDYDMLVAMDPENVSNLRRMMRRPDKQSKIHLLREFDPQGGKGMAVPDPYYGGVDGFDDVYDLVDRSTRGLLDALEKDGTGEL